MTKIRQSDGVRTLAAILALAVCATGCLQPSLNPLFLPEDAVFDEGLLGTWVCQDETWTFARTADEDWRGREVFTVTIQRSDNDTTSELFAWLGRLDGALFATFTPKSDLPAPNRFFARHVVPVYTFGRITIEPTRLRLNMLDADWIEKAEAAGLLTIGVKRTEPRSDVLLSAKPAELQRFARAYADNDDVFSDRVEFVRPIASDSTTAGAAVRAAGHCYAEK